MSRSTDIGAAAWRISRLNAITGAPDFDNPVGAFAVCGGVSKLTHDFEIEEGDKIFAKDSTGNACVNIVRDDIEKWVNFEITLCKDDYRVWEILGLADLFAGPGPDPAGVGVGFTMAAGCAPVTKARVALELWVEQYDCDALVATYPYKRYVFTRCVMSPQGYDVASEPSMPVFAGKAFNNAMFGDGPFGDLDVLVNNGFVGAFARLDDTALPVCPDPLNYIGIPPSSS